MGIKGRFLKAECAVLAATVMLSPLMLCACNEKPEPTETETEVTEPSATETVFVPTPFPSASDTALSDQEAETEAIKLASKVGLEKDDLRGKYSFFLRYYKAVVTNTSAKDYYAYLFKFFPLVADHIKPEGEENYLKKINTLEMIDVPKGDFAGGYDGYSIMFKSDVMKTWGENYRALVVYHETMHFVDAHIDGEIGTFYYLDDGTFKFVSYSDPEYMEFMNHGNYVECYSMGYLVEGGAEKYKTEYFTKASTDPNPTGLEFLVGLEYIFGKETVDDLYFSNDGDLKFTNLLKDNGFSTEEIIRMLNTSVTDKVMKDETKYIDPREVLIRLYINKIGPDYEKDAKFCRIIASLNKDIINKIPTEYRSFITKVTKNASKESGNLKKAAKKKLGLKGDVYFESDPYPIFLDGELKLVVMATTYKKDKPVYTSVVFDYDFDKKSVKQISKYTNWKLDKLELNIKDDIEFIRGQENDNSAAHNQTVRGSNPALDSLYHMAEEIGNKHGVYFWFDDLTPESLISEIKYLKVCDPNEIRSALNQVEAVLDLYPEDYFDQLVRVGGYNGIGICFYNEKVPSNWLHLSRSYSINGLNYLVLFVATGYDYSVGGDIEKHYGEYYIRDRFNKKVTAIQARLICDIWDLTDNFIDRANFYSEEPLVSNADWQKTNYKEFKYYESDDANNADYVSSSDKGKTTSYVVKENVKMNYFICTDSVASADTDRHLLYEYLMMSALSGEKPIKMTEEQKAKAQELSRGLRKVFDTSKWPDKTSWENAI